MPLAGTEVMIKQDYLSHESYASYGTKHKMQMFCFQSHLHCHIRYV